MMKITAICLGLLALAASVWGQCSQDFECANAPYAMCNGGVNDCKSTLKGLGVSEETKQVYFAQICRTDSRFSNITFKKVSANGGVAVTVLTQQQVADVVNPDQLFDVVGDQLFFSSQSKTPGHILSTLKLSSASLSGSIDTGAHFQGAIEFDIANKKAYACNLAMEEFSGAYTVDRYDAILGAGLSVTKTTLFSLRITEACSAIRVSGSDVFVSVTDVSESNKEASSKVYKQTGGSGEPTLLFTLKGQTISDFDVSGDRIFYATSSGVFSSDFSGASVKRFTWTHGASGVRVMGDKVFWNSGVSIVSASLDGSNVAQVNTFAGKCQCRTGFTGPACDQCVGGQVQWKEGVPSCITVSADGNPSTCNYDYECASTPYGFCDGTCKCRAGFSGAGCATCSGTVSWSNGIPSCQ